MRGSRAPPPPLENLIFLNSNSKISENMPWIPLANSNITRTPLPRKKKLDPRMHYKNNSSQESETPQILKKINAAFR